jgi:uncharacterized protein
MSPFRLRSPLACTLATLGLALLAAGLCVRLGTPIPWMIGPLLATALVSVAGGPTTSDPRLRNAGQWVLGTALGLYFTPQVTALVLGLWWVVVVGVVWALALGLLFGRWLHVRHARLLPDVPAESLRATTYFASAIGGASEMTLLAERAGARTDLVAAAHSLRLLIVVLVMPFGMQWAQSAWHFEALDLAAPAARAVHLGGLAALALVTGLGALLMAWLDRANPWFMGALLAAMAVTASGLEWSGLPPWLSNAAQLVIGVSLGVRFTPAFVHTAPRWLGSVALGSGVMIALCAGLALLLSRVTALHPATLVLGTAPGGIAEMAITAKVLQLGVAMVTALQVSRLVAVLVLVAPLYHWLTARRRRRAGPGRG